MEREGHEGQADRLMEGNENNQREKHVWRKRETADIQRSSLQAVLGHSPRLPCNCFQGRGVQKETPPISASLSVVLHWCARSPPPWLKRRADKTSNWLCHARRLPSTRKANLKSADTDLCGEVEDFKAPVYSRSYERGCLKSRKTSTFRHWCGAFSYSEC